MPHSDRNTSNGLVRNPGRNITFHMRGCVRGRHRRHAHFPYRMHQRNLSAFRRESFCLLFKA